MSDATRPFELLSDPRRRITEDHRVALARKQAELRVAEDRLHPLLQELAELRRELSELLRKARVISPTQMLLGDEARQSILETIEVQQEEVREAEEEVALARQALLAARGDELLLELLRERQLHRHLARRPRADFAQQHVDPLTGRGLASAR